jgi:hypothetical protein
MKVKELYKCGLVLFEVLTQLHWFDYVELSRDVRVVTQSSLY